MKIRNLISNRKVAFWLVLIFLAAFIIEAPFQVLAFVQRQKLAHDQESLITLPDEELANPGDGGWRIVESFKDMVQFKKILSDVLRLDRGGITRYPEYKLLTKGVPYFSFKVNNMGFRGPNWRWYKPA